MSALTFEKGSELKAILERGFAFTAIRHIVIPKSVIALKLSAFDGCMQLQTVEFQKGSRLALCEAPDSVRDVGY